MPAVVSYPGVYVLEEESGARAIPAASTSLTVFVGMADKGPFEVPTQVLGLPAYEAKFGATSRGEMADQVRQFFVNGGGEAWIFRTALNAQHASVVLRDGAAGDVLRLTARDPGVSGNLIRAEVDYATASPERTFNLKLYRLVPQLDGSFKPMEAENHADLSMDPASPRYATTILESTSSLVTASDPSAPLATNPSVSISGVVFSSTATTARGTINTIIATNNTNNTPVAILVRVGANPPVPVVFGAPPGQSNVLTFIESTIQTALANAGIAVTITATVPASGTVGRLLQIASSDGAIAIAPLGGSPGAVALGLGIASGGVEIDRYSARRPVPTGITSLPGNVAGTPGTAWLDGIVEFGGQTRGAISQFQLSDPANGAAHTGPALGGVAADVVMLDPAAPAGAVGTLAAIRAALEELGTAVAANSGTRWSYQRQGLRLSLRPKFGGSNTGLDSALTTAAPSTYDVGTGSGIFVAAGAANVAAYSLGQIGGAGGLGPRQASVVGDTGADGDKPDVNKYISAFNTIESVLASFNIMVLPRAVDQTDVERRQVWGFASASCAKRRAILLVDPDSTWTTVEKASAGIDTIKTGIDIRNAAIFWPHLKIPQGGSVVPKTVDPAGTIAGLMARTDVRFGVWTAPAGLEATLRGIVGINRVMSDEENGVLNPKALNAIRQFPVGAVSWGARMMVGSNDSGNIDDKYLPVRRTMLFIEESLYRGLKFAVFRPNAEPLWASIRLAAGSFMNGLMRQGAFASDNKLTAYYVLCDETTTTETDRNLGIVNVIVGFAPLKPSEFIVLTVKQIAGQIEI